MSRVRSNSIGHTSASQVNEAEASSFHKELKELQSSRLKAVTTVSELLKKIDTYPQNTPARHEAGDDLVKLPVSILIGLSNETNDVRLNSYDQIGAALKAKGYTRISLNGWHELVTDSLSMTNMAHLFEFFQRAKITVVGLNLNAIAAKEFLAQTQSPVMDKQAKPATLERKASLPRLTMSAKPAELERKPSLARMAASLNMPTSVEKPATFDRSASLTRITPPAKMKALDMATIYNQFSETMKTLEVSPPQLYCLAATATKYWNFQFSELAISTKRRFTSTSSSYASMLKPLLMESHKPAEAVVKCDPTEEFTSEEMLARTAEKQRESLESYVSQVCDTVIRGLGWR